MTIRHLVVLTAALLIVLLISAISSNATAQADNAILLSPVEPSTSR